MRIKLLKYIIIDHQMGIIFEAKKLNIYTNVILQKTIFVLKICLQDNQPYQVIESMLQPVLWIQRYKYYISHATFVLILDVSRRSSSLFSLITWSPLRWAASFHDASWILNSSLSYSVRSLHSAVFLQFLHFANFFRISRTQHTEADWVITLPGPTLDWRMWG